MTQPHSITMFRGEDIFVALRRWKSTAPPGHRGNIFFRRRERGELEFPTDFIDEGMRDLNTTEDRAGNGLRLAVQSVADTLAGTLLTGAGDGIDCGPLVEALHRRRYATG